MKNSVAYYSKGILHWTVNFPNGEEACQWCPFCVKDSRNYLRAVCFLSSEILVFPEMGRGIDCPLEMEGRTNGKP